MEFIISGTDKHSSARAGVLQTDSGTIHTPIFMPVGTHGAVKGMYMKQLDEDVAAEIILGNTYHLYLRPGMDVIGQAGGLHKFNGWNKPILTDSGGFQVFSLHGQRKITEEGVKFLSDIDGSKHLFTPENVIDIQRTIGSDIIMAFDECTPYPTTEQYAEQSMQRTHRWLVRCYQQWKNTDSPYGRYQSLFPIVQGSVFRHLREQSAEFVANMDCDGNAIGGVSVGEPTELMYEMTAVCCDILPKSKPRYLMGVGTPANILECIALGVDMFDCVMPTRNGRHGILFTKNGIINIKNAKWKYDFSPIEEDSDLFEDKNYSKAYLRHLLINQEMLSSMICSLHNLHFYLWLVKESRKHILDGDFSQWKTAMVQKVSTRL